MDNLVQQLTSALQVGDFDTHRSLLPAYRDSVTAAVDAAGTSAFKMELLAAAMRQNDEWLHLAQAMRSHIQQQLVTVTGESHYYSDRDERHIIHTMG